MKATLFILAVLLFSTCAFAQTFIRLEQSGPGYVDGYWYAGEKNSEWDVSSQTQSGYGWTMCKYNQEDPEYQCNLPVNCYIEDSFETEFEDEATDRTLLFRLQMFGGWAQSKYYLIRTFE